MAPIARLIALAMVTSLGACATAPPPLGVADRYSRTTRAEIPRSRQKPPKPVPVTNSAESDVSIGEDEPAPGDYEWLARENARIEKVTTICNLCAVPSAPAKPVPGPVLSPALGLLVSRNDR